MYRHTTLGARHHPKLMAHKGGHQIRTWESTRNSKRHSIALNKVSICITWIRHLCQYKEMHMCPRITLFLHLYRREWSHGFLDPSPNVGERKRIIIITRNAAVWRQVSVSWFRLRRIHQLASITSCSRDLSCSRQGSQHASIPHEHEQFEHTSSIHR